MNTNNLLIIGFVILSCLVFSQDEDELEFKVEDFEYKVEKWGENYQIAMESGDFSPSFQSTSAINLVAEIGESASTEKVKFGMYLEDLDFETAYEMHYPHNYGVLIESVITGSNAHKAGLTDDDIIMEFDGEKVRYEDHLISLRNTKKVGDIVDIKFFRNENIQTTSLTFQPPEKNDYNDDKNFSITKSGEKKKHLSPGFGGGYPTMIKLDYKFSGFNTLIAEYGFAPLSADNAVMYGGGGMGNIGNGWFLGGMGAGMVYTKSIPSKIENFNKSSLKIESGFGGVSILKKIPLFTERVVLDLGTTLGGGETSIEIANTDGTYSWDNIGGNSNAKYNKSYFTFYPEVGILVRIKNWVGIRAGAGQLLTYSADESWTDSTFGMNIAGDSPSPLSGRSLSLAIWFGF